jgi:hypothetical protein
MKLKEVALKAPAKMIERKLAVSSRGHSTTDEKDFLNGIGTYSPNIQFSRRRYVEEYMKAAMVRVRWGNINKQEVLEHCQKLLLNLGGSKW